MLGLEPPRAEPQPHPSEVGQGGLHCFHCGEAIAPGSLLRSRLQPDQAEHDFCCAGCEAAAGFIVGAGLADYYRLRSATPERPDALREAETEARRRIWDSQTVRRLHWQQDDEGVTVRLPLGGLKCAACSWLIERVLQQEPGVLGVTPNLQLASVSLRFDPERARLSDLVERLASLGYQARLPDQVHHEQILPTEQAGRASLKRLAVAGLCMMQAMMFAEPLYFAAFGAPMGPETRDLFRWLGLALATPVLFYSGAGFLTGAWRELRFGQLGMDTPIALALLLAYGASVVETLRQGPDVYFDSVTMFVFFLLLGRHLEAMARHRNQSQMRALAQGQPSFAWRVDANPEAASTGGSRVEREVHVAELQVGDVVRVYPGQAAPADGVLLVPEGVESSMHVAMDEALLTGESVPVLKRAGDPVYAGALATDQPLLMRVHAVGTRTALQQLLRLMHDAFASRPRWATVADALARKFAMALLWLCAAVALIWGYIDPARAFAITLATLAVACPCALALAIPAAITAAQARMARAGILLLRAQALEPLARVTHVVFDKTGTLTTGKAVLGAVNTYGRVDQQEALALAAGLEHGSLHPLAHAFAEVPSPATINALKHHPGLGISGNVLDVDGAPRQLRLGRRDFVLEMAVTSHADKPWGEKDAICLGDEHGLLAEFEVRESLRPDAGPTLAALREEGLGVAIFSGDGATRVADVAAELGVDHARGRLLPADKLRALQALQARGEVVAMVGDGSNDGPVLAGADVSLALASGTASAHQAADLVLLGQKLSALPEALGIARTAVRVMHQNLLWAAGYNVCGILVAAIGWMPPWLAALGMSLSSLLVTANALRINYGSGTLAERKAPVMTRPWAAQASSGSA